MTIEAQADGMIVNSDSGHQKTVARHQRETREMTVEAATKRGGDDSRGEQSDQQEDDRDSEDEGDRTGGKEARDG